MQAEIIAVGTELTTGAKLDTNSQWLSRQLGALGIPVRFHTAVADTLEAMVEVFSRAADRCEIVLITGGLGPTQDDLTRQAMAEVRGTGLILDRASLEFIESLFARRQRSMPERNRLQAMLPQGAEPIANPRGTAPGIWMELFRNDGPEPCRMIAMPGVPSEMQRMFREEVQPRLPHSRHVIREARLHCFGVGESSAEEILGDLTGRRRNPDVGITAHHGTITLRITAWGASADECEARIAVVKKTVGKRMGALIFGEEDQTLPEVVIGQLQQRGATLSTAESGTGGCLADWLTGVAGFEPCYTGGLVVPSTMAKTNLLGMDPGMIRDAGSISGEVAEAMAVGCRRILGTDFALSVTECPRFDPDDEQTESPTAYVALAAANGTEVQPHTLVGDPAIAKSRAASTALDLLRHHLLE